MLFVSFPRAVLMIPMSEARFQQRLRPLPAIQAEGGELSLEERHEQVFV